MTDTSFVSRRQAPEEAVLAARKPFGRYKKESANAVRTFEIVETKALAKIRKAWERYVKATAHETQSTELKCKDAAKFVSGLEYSADDVTSFSILVGDYSDYGQLLKIRIGLFISALINEGQDEEYVIYTSSFEENSECLCSDNTKNVTVHGDAGDWFADNMKSGIVRLLGSCGFASAGMEGGKLMIEGDCSDEFAVNMKGGEATVLGNATKNFGYEMMGGKLTIMGNAGADVGAEMRGGEIHLMGDFENIGYAIRGGRIYHKDKLILGTEN